MFRVEAHTPHQPWKRQFCGSATLLGAALLLAGASAYLFVKGDITKFKIRPLCFGGIGSGTAALVCLTASIYLFKRSKERAQEHEKKVHIEDHVNNQAKEVLNSGDHGYFLRLATHIDHPSEELIGALVDHYRPENFFTIHQIPLTFQTPFLLECAKRIVDNSNLRIYDRIFECQSYIVEAIVEHEDISPLRELTKAPADYLQSIEGSLIERINQNNGFTVSHIQNGYMRRALASSYS